MTPKQTPVKKASPVKKPVIQPTALPISGNAFSIPGFPLPLALAAYGASGYAMPNAPIDKDSLEIAKTPLGSFTLKKEYLANTVVLIGGSLLVLFGIGGLIWSQKQTIVKVAADVGKAAAVAA